MAAEYTRGDVRRRLDVPERLLRTWEKKGFVEGGAAFGFEDLIALKALKKLSELGIAPSRIERALLSLKAKLSHIERPLAQLRITAEGKRITVHVAGGRMEPITGQLLLDFDRSEAEKLRSFPVSTAPKVDPQAEAKEREAEHWFQRGLMLEESGAPPQDALAAYRRAIQLNPKAAGALVNLGTISFRMKKLAEAKDFYLRAVEADPDYPLAHFNLGNLFDEQGKAEEARKHYLEAIRLNPKYADAYFNLALLCERGSELLKAIGYWQKYLSLDWTSGWAASARKQLERLKRSVRTK